MSKSSNKRILIVNANWLGDVLFSTPSLRAIRKAYPESHIACLVPPRAGEVLRHNPHLSEVLLCEDRPNLLSWKEYARVVSELRQRHFDTAVFFHRSKTRVFLTKIAGIPERIGYGAQGRDGLLTTRVERPLKPLHKIDMFLNLIMGWGVPSDGRHMEFFPEAASEASFRNLLSTHGLKLSERYAVVHAGGNWDLKRWNVPYFAETIRGITREFGLKVILCGSSGEERVARELTSLLCTGEIISLSGKTSLDELALLLKNAEFLLSNDSGPIHLAATQKTKIIGLFGPTSPLLTGPVSLGTARLLVKDVGCEVPCYYRTCQDRVCMDWLTPAEVLENVRILLNE